VLFNKRNTYTLWENGFSVISASRQ